MSTREGYIGRLSAYFDCLGSIECAKTMATAIVPSQNVMREVVLALPEAEIIAAAGFHGDIGQSKVSLDAHAAAEQSAVLQEAEAIRAELLSLGAQYKAQFGIKFLVSAKGKTAAEMLEILKQRLNNTRDEEWLAARLALFEIAWKRVIVHPLLAPLVNVLEDLAASENIAAAQVTISVLEGQQSMCVGEDKNARFQVASLSKSVGTAFALEYFAKHKISISTPVNQFLKTHRSDFVLTSVEGAPPEWADQVTIQHLMRHNALNLHYVKGFPLDKPIPSARQMLDGSPAVGLDPVKVIAEPGTHFKYSGAGFMVLEYLIELHSGKHITELSRPWLDALGMQDFSFSGLGHSREGVTYATGRNDRQEAIEGGRLFFPAFAAGALSTTEAMHRFLQHLTTAYHSVDGSSVVSHETARLMLHDRDSRSLECLQFMGCKMGTGIFVLEGEQNKFMLHQGANDGFRALFFHCFDGPNKGAGLTAICTADAKGVSFIAHLSQRVLRALDLRGVCYDQFKSSFSGEGLRQEDVVNKGYRHLVFNAFRTERAEPIGLRGSRMRWADRNLAVGGEVLYCTNDRFASAENILSARDPLFDPALFGPQGKVMDSWESVRHNPEDHDEMAFQLPNPSAIRYASLSTKWHYGNHAPYVRVEGQCADGSWVELVPKTPMDGHSERLLTIDVPEVKDLVFSTVKVQTFPDGGFSRLGLYSSLPLEDIPLFDGTMTACKEPIPQTQKPLSLPYEATAEEVKKNLSRLQAGELCDAASMAYGGLVTFASNQHYGLAKYAIAPFPPLNMFDGLESARSRKPGSHEELVVKLAWKAQVQSILLDFHYFVNNNPLELEIAARGNADEPWKVVVPHRRVKHHRAGQMKVTLEDNAMAIAELQVKCFPCGGLNRIHVFALAPSELVQLATNQ